ncbi:uncharacterized protein JCM15063_000075 [Sporobolomyces koalae]|uniref:uncharacterized protein n=1 Tax=Sporobolomyces koalae TaxID=500713 RepID=UPI0031788781
MSDKENGHAPQHLSLEPLPLVVDDGQDADLFARPARLADVNLESGQQVYTRHDPKKSLQERLMRVWAERGDYSLVTEQSIRNPEPEPSSSEPDAEELDARENPTPEQMRHFAESLVNNLAIARGELSTALDLLNVLSPATDPPNVDPNTIPLAHSTLGLVRTSTPPLPSADTASSSSLSNLALAESLAALKRNAKSFFSASEDLIPLEAGDATPATVPTSTPSSKRKPTQSPDPWPTILSLHSNSPGTTLVPLGAASSGATLTGKGEMRSARQVGVFYGFQEADRAFRNASIARVGELVEVDVERQGGRQLSLELSNVSTGISERRIWRDVDRDTHEPEDGVKEILRKRNRSAFAEEVFARLVKETKSDPTLNAQYRLGGASLAKNESITIDAVGGYNLTISMIPPNSPLESTPTGECETPIALVLPLLRLLFLQEYSARRANSSKTRPLLSTITTGLQYATRVDALKHMLQRISTKWANEEREIDTELWSGKQKISLEEREGNSLEHLKADVGRILRGEVELGGRALIRLDSRHTFHILFSLPIPTSTTTTTTAVAAAPAVKPAAMLTLRTPGKPQPIAIPSLRHLEEFLNSELETLAKKKIDRKS